MKTSLKTWSWLLLASMALINCGTPETDKIDFDKIINPCDCMYYSYDISKKMDALDLIIEEMLLKKFNLDEIMQSKEWNKLEKQKSKLLEIGTYCKNKFDKSVLANCITENIDLKEINPRSYSELIKHIYLSPEKKLDSLNPEKLPRLN